MHVCDADTFFLYCRVLLISQHSLWVSVCFLWQQTGTQRPWVRRGMVSHEQRIEIGLIVGRDNVKGASRSFGDSVVLSSPATLVTEGVWA